MRAQLSLEFLVILALSLSYVAFSLTLAQQMSYALTTKAQQMTLDDLKAKLEFAAKSRGEFVFNIKRFPGTRLAVWSENDRTILASCSGNGIITSPLDLKSAAGKAPEDCASFPDSNKLVVRNYGVMEIESPVVA